MNTHKNAQLTFAARVAVVSSVLAGMPASTVAQDRGVSARTVWKWVARYREGGERALADRSSRPHHPRQLHRTLRRQILKARGKRWSSVRIAQYYHVPLSTVVTLVRRAGLAHLARLEPQRPVVRYEKARPGELVHVDIKKLARFTRVGHRIHGDRRQHSRGAGWECLHVAIDDHSRVSYAEVLADEQTSTVLGFFLRAAHWFASRGIVVEAWMTDNGSAYRSRALAVLCTANGWGHVFTRPYTPRTNGKAERFIRTLLAEWAYVRPYRSSAVRQAALPFYVHFYNTERRHTALNYATPLSRLLALK